ncbi:MAG: EF-hand domain-containing protein [gamma proteobacterium endosymbiont of Lamellibrachia anaximandri]|nr:EF-hand domain-containing protein [gamma proteobacterium endosymbiont of Lamellibrachia anaximandri]
MKMLYKSIFTILLSGTALFAAAQSPSYLQRGPVPFEAYDRDGSGAITTDEFNALRNERRAARAAEGRPMRNAAKAPTFEQLDLNADGVLGSDEMAAFRQQQMSQRPNGKGSGKGAEMASGRGAGRGRNMPSFAEFDLNGDGAMTEDEFIEARGRRISERAKQGYMMRGLKNARPFSEVDQDGDGVVKESEFLQMQAQHRQSRSQ